ncbi:hypothetical protein BEWA_000220 [Theileria equi strain WA]|uniref:Signal peptide containing protein n=1 Tax=Theileria equi strain WA TaxID=1537102 RepID=L0AZC5_THEEQ|nr:hypothetical protein BEWA_000220 [Theileria equi strain WA]AFZ80618.1 hypothetical protein BEWA_000220 [Theileria equi strain WA]|eukprot:XP_004830284.1 hypothetical protein BEWA_000220 [Theileria equi strain WA]
MEIMNILIFTIGILGSVAVDPKGTSSGSNSLQLDIAKPSVNLFSQERSTSDDIPVVKITPKNNGSVTKIVEADLLVWESESGQTSHMATVYYDGETAVSVTVRYRDVDGKSFDRFFNKDNDEWERVNTEDQDDLLNMLKKKGQNTIAHTPAPAPAPAPAARSQQRSRKPIVLNLEESDSELFDMTEEDEGRATKRVYSARQPANGLTEVIEGDFELWKSDSDDKHCKSAIIYFDEDDEPQLAYFLLEDASGRLVARRQKRDGRWNTISKDDYEKAIEDMKLGAQLSGLKDIELDISDVDANVFTVENSNEGQASCKKCTPRPGNNLTEIFELNVPLWEGKPEESCEQVILYSLSNTALLALLQINKDTGRSTSRHQKKDNRWVVISQEDFDQVLTEMREGRAQLPVATTDKPQSQGGGSKIVTLSINADPDPTRFKAFDFYMDDVKTRMFTFSGGYNPVKIVDGNQNLLWRAMSGEKCRYILVHTPDRSYTFAHLFITTTIIVDDLFSHYDGKKWSMNDSKYRDKLKAIKVKTNRIANFRMDINQRTDTTQCKVVSTDFDGISAVLLIPTKGYHAVNVHFGSQVLWQAEKDGDRCTFAVLRIIDNENVLLSLTVRKSDHKFVSVIIIKNGDKWSYIDSKTYFSNLCSLDAAKALNQALTLDINLVPHESKCKSEVSTSKRFRSLTYYPCPRNYTNALVDGPCKLWSTNAHGERCVESQVHYNHGSYALCKFTVTNIENRSTAYYFVKEGGTWKKSGIDDFYQKLSNMGSNVPESYSLKVDENFGDGACGFCNFECDVLHSSLHVPSSQRFVDALIYDSHPFWVSASIDVGCVMIFVDYKDRFPLLARLRLSNYHDGDNIYFGMKNGRWTPINATTYDQHRESLELNIIKGRTPHGESCLQLLPESKDMKKAVLPRSSKFVTLDITEISSQHCTIIKCELDDVLTSLFFVNPEQPVGSIRDGPIDIWKSESESECIFASVAHNLDHENILVYLIVRGSDDTVGVECYMKDLNVWLSIDKSSYDEHINNLRLKTPFKATFTVDITSKEDNIMCRSTSVLLDDLPTSLFIPHSGYHATKIVEGKATVWVAKGDERCVYLSTRYQGGNPYLLYLGINSEDGRDAKHYEKKDSVWTEIEKTVYDNKLANLKTANIQFNTVKYRLIGLDIKSPAVYDFDVKKDDGPNSTVMITPRSGIKMVSVSEGNLGIWETISQGVHCLKVSVNMLDSRPTMASLFIADASGNTVLYIYTKKGGEWEFTQSADYNSSYRSYTTVVLDIGNYDKKLGLEVESFTFDGKKYTKYTPSPSSNLRIMTVMDGNQMIWDSSSDDECCADVTLFSDQTENLYCYITVLASEKGTSARCFVMNSGKWFSNSTYEFRPLVNKLFVNISSTVRATLDIGSEYNEYFKVVNFDMDDVPTRLYYPLGDFIVEKVVDGQTVLWNHTPGKPFKYAMAHYSDGKCVLIDIFFELGVPGSHIYYHRQQGGIWKSVSKGNYDAQFISMGVKTDIKSTFTLDATVAFDTDECKVISCEIHGIATYFYIPKSGYHATKVIDYGLDAWTPSGNERCIFFTAYLKNGVFSLFDVVKISGSSLSSDHFRRKFLRDDDPECDGSQWYQTNASINMNRWKPTTVWDGKVKKRFNKIKASVSVLNIDTVTDDRHFYTEDRYAQGTHVIRHTARFGKYITSVKHSDLEIWKTQDGMTCIDAFVYVERGTNKLLYLLLWNPKDSGKFSILHYRRESHTSWAKTTRRRYTAMLDSLMYLSFRYGFNMDVSAKTSNHACEIVECHIQDVPACLHAPRNKFQLNTISDGDSIIWKRRCDKRVVFATVYFQNGKPYLCDIIMKNFSWDVENVCFKKDLYGWTMITKKDYVRKLALIKFKAPYRATISVDVSNVPDTCRQINMTVDGSLVEIFMPLPGYRINKITDGINVLGAPREGQVFSFYARSDDTECVVGKHIPSRSAGSGQLEKDGTEWPNIAHQNMSFWRMKYFTPKIYDYSVQA